MIIATTLLLIRLVAWFRFAQLAGWALLWSWSSYAVSLIAQCLITVWAVDLYNLHDTPVPATVNKAIASNELKLLGYTMAVIAIALGKVGVAAYFAALLGTMHRRQRIGLYTLALLDVTLAFSPSPYTRRCDNLQTYRLMLIGPSSLCISRHHGGELPIPHSRHGRHASLLLEAAHSAIHHPGLLRRHR